MRRTATIAIWIACLTATAWAEGCSTDTQQPSAAGSGGSSEARAGSPGAGAAGAIDGTAVQFARDVFPIVRDRCAIPGCHVSGTTTNHFTDFSTAQSTYLRWVNAPGFDFCSEPDGGIYVQRTIVVPGAPEQSYLVAKITSTREEPCPQLHSPRMPPPPLPPLAADQIQIIVTWIQEGARDN